MTREAVSLISIPDPTNGTAVWQQAARLSMRVCYCSVFKDCWFTIVADLNTGTPSTVETDSCPLSSPRFF